ncbi:MAG: Stf0 family sulfotransferase [Acidocella sp.]
MRDLSVDKGAFIRELAATNPPSRKYIIMFTARSGSTWLTNVLSGTKLLGTPEEFINPDFVLGVARSLNTKEPAPFLELLQCRRKSPNGVFGMEVRHIDIELFGEDVFFKTFGENTVFFNLWRENIVAQAVSLYRAVSSGRYHSTDNAAPTVPPYDADHINRWLMHLHLQENANIKLLGKRGIIFDNLRYETMVKNRETTLELFFDRLGLKDQQKEIETLIATELQKVGDCWNDETEQRFRAERASSIAEFEDSRLVRKLPPKDIAI